MQVELKPIAFARNWTKCGNKGKQERQVALHSPMMRRCAGGQGLGDHGGEVNTQHENIFYVVFRVNLPPNPHAMVPLDPGPGHNVAPLGYARLLALICLYSRT